MKFYLITDGRIDVNPPALRATLSEAHAIAKTNYDRKDVEISEVDVPTDKASLCNIIDIGLQRKLDASSFAKTGPEWNLTPRGGLKKGSEDE